MSEDRWILVSGASRSGTTLLSRALGRHSKILGMNELHYFGDIFSPSMTDGIISRETAIKFGASIIARQNRGIWYGSPEAEEFHASQVLVAGMGGIPLNGLNVFETVTLWLAHKSGKSIPCEQTPRNIYYAKVLIEKMPGVQMVHMLRDPRAVLASQKNRWKRRSHSNKHIPFFEMVRVWANYHPFTMVKLWIQATKIAEDLVGTPRFVLVHYEDLVRNPEHQLRNILASVDLDLEPAMLDVDVVGSSQRQDVGAKGFSKESLDSWKDILNPAEIWIVERLSRRIMLRNGYDLFSKEAPVSQLLISALLYPLHVLAVMVANPRRAIIQLRGILLMR